MKLIFATAVSEPIYNFTQMCFANDTDVIRATPFSHQLADAFFTEYSPAKAISAKEAISLPLDKKRVLHELLTQYIMFFSLNPDLPFPSDFLQGTNDLQLGVALTDYFLRHKFPFPQLLPH